jgi:predicted RND superfamily exporter protein
VRGGQACISFTIPYLTGQSVFYIAYLIISSIQLGATVDYAILLTERYRENRDTMDKKKAVKETVADCTASILTSGTVMTVVGLLLGKISTHGVLSQLGTFLGIGTLLSMGMVLFVLPGLLYLFDRLFTRKK